MGFRTSPVTTTIMNQQLDPEIVVLNIGMEGGGVTILGREDNGTWRFWCQGSTIALDENDDEEWRDWTSDTKPTIAELLPSFWHACFPLTVHPAFRDEIRALYYAHLEALSEHERNLFGGHSRYNWEQLFSE
jgi:hypothetical protein